MATPYTNFLWEFQIFHIGKNSHNETLFQNETAFPYWTGISQNEKVFQYEKVFSEMKQLVNMETPVQSGKQFHIGKKIPANHQQYESANIQKIIDISKFDLKKC